ncbi:GAF domain-containing protein [Myxococcota bacterium]|nr:GAF domain-containing protein [Myxococcota bacterium]
MAHSDRTDQTDHAAALLELFARGTEITRQLVDETERLRRLARESVGVCAGESDGVAPSTAPTPLDLLRGENEALSERLRSAEASNARWAARQAETERCHDELANLFVASDQLHATRDPDEVVSAISEIVINLIGAEAFVLYAADAQPGYLTPFVSEGSALLELEPVVVGEGVIGRAVARGTVWLAEADASAGSAEEEDTPIVVIPLCARGSVLGAIAIFKLLDQKAGLCELDYQLFDLLAQHASTALHFARMQEPSWSAVRKSLRPIERITN